jgi:IS30 family transposase
MLKSYTRLTYNQRCQIFALKSTAMSQTSIAKTVSVSQSTISRELSRNAKKGNYDSEQAHKNSKHRQHQIRTKPIIMNAEIIEKINSLVMQQWSPVQISGRLKLEGISISHETIYRYIREDNKADGMLYQHLRHKGKKYNKRLNNSAGRGCIPNRVDIKDRPPVVEEKTRVGDWEGDLIIGAQHNGAILTYVDRTSKKTIMAKLDSKHASGVVNATIEKFSGLHHLVKTITYDNGKEFSSHELVSKGLQASCYFATPYHSWERGLNEHTNGLIRQYLPKSTNLKLVTNEEIMKIESLLNNRPRKVLGFKTLNEVFAIAENNHNYALAC